jgi:gliding motility-associated lipoprotein GldJ
MNKVTLVSSILILSALMFSCKKGSKGSDVSSLTSMKYNDAKNGGFEVNTKYKGQDAAPGMVFIQGGAYMMGQKDQDVMYEWNNVPRKMTVNSFYMDETEVANVHYREYLFWINRVFGESFPEVYRRALPDTLVWRDELAYNEPLVENYLRHPAYNNYPVVGVSWLQANDFCKWRSDRVNEEKLVKLGAITSIPDDQVDENNFNTESYLAGKFEPEMGKKPFKTPTKEDRSVRLEDGVLQPSFRLPTESEWEYAAYSLIGNQPYKDEERFTDQNIYPWKGFSMRYPKTGKDQGRMLANFKRGRGDNMGIAGHLNDNAAVTAEVKSYYPNDFGLYNMAGNVNEWVMDVYRPMNSIDMNDFAGFRGNVYKTKKTTEDGEIEDVDSLGRLKYRTVTEEEAGSRRNYRSADVRNFVDQDKQSEVEYRYGETSLINDQSRVYKGGSWKDRVYWLSPGTRRHLQEYQSTDDIGFRCAMDRMGSPISNKIPSGNHFKKR